NCPIEAGEAAKKANTKVVYAVGGKKYDDMEKAYTAYADVMDDFVVKFASVRTAEECKASCSGSCHGEKSEGCCSGSNAKTTGTSKEVAAHGEKSECTHAKDGQEGHGKTVAAHDEKGECPFSKSSKATVAKSDGKTPVMYC